MALRHRPLARVQPVDPGRERSTPRSLTVAIVMVLAAAPLSCARAQPNPEAMRDLWVPREATRGLVIDESSSQTWDLYLPEERAPAAEQGPKRARSAASTTNTGPRG